MKKLILILALLFVSNSLYSTPPDSCLKMICNNDYHFDPGKNAYTGSYNPDSVMIDNCEDSPTYKKRFAKRYFTIRFERNFYPFDSVIKPHTSKTVSDLSDSKPECKFQFQQLETIYGTIYFEGELYEAENDSIFYLNPGVRLYFEYYHATDEIEATFLNNIDSLRYISFDANYGTPLTSDMNEAKESKNNLLIYPNPVKNILEIKSLSNEYFNHKITIYNLSGQILIESKYQEVIDISNLTQGIYFLKLGNNAYKFIKE